ncbi:MAG TPA: thiamine-phosphate kinase [Candidatus Rubrimentiphilum sp.]|nr:thiamine-phosphate kinase [Candidatus Rubrimentiphilum sp.]
MSAILTGIGDDAAVWQPSRSHRSIVTTDAFVENVHFTREHSLENAGRRAMAASLSDIAAMGARPVLATISLALPAENARADALALYRGIAECAQENACAIAGGDLTRAPLVALTVTVVGEVRASNVKLRSGARPGDVIAVTGPLGAARAAGFRAVPSPRMAEGRWLAASACVRAMMDVSDGLSTDLLRMCAQSKCGALIERVPVADSARAAARSAGEEPEKYVLAAGEDYELLIAVKARAFRYVATRFRKRFGRDLERVGTLRESAGVFRKTGASEQQVAATGWDHFS